MRRARSTGNLLYAAPRFPRTIDDSRKKLKRRGGGYVSVVIWCCVLSAVFEEAGLVTRPFSLYREPGGRTWRLEAGFLKLLTRFRTVFVDTLGSAEQGGLVMTECEKQFSLYPRSVK